MPSDRVPEQLLTASDVSAWLSVNEGTLRVWRHQRKGPPFVRAGARSVRYRRADVEAWLSAQTESA